MISDYANSWYNKIKKSLKKLREFNTDTSFFLKFALPVGERRFEGHVLCSLLIPVDYGSHRYATTTNTNITRIRNTYLTSKGRPTVHCEGNSTFWGGGTTRHIVSICIYPEPWWCCGGTREIPRSIGIGEYIWVICQLIQWSSVTDTACKISLYLPAIRLITRESEPIRISQIGHSFDTLSGEIDCLDPIFRVTSKVNPADHSGEHSCHSEPENRYHGHDFYQRGSIFIEMPHQRELHFLILLLSWRVVYRGYHLCFHRTRWYRDWYHPWACSMPYWQNSTK